LSNEIGSKAGRAFRLCLSCAAAEEVGNAERIWPAAWQCPACGAVVAMRDGFPLFAPDLADQAVGMDPKVFDFLIEAEERHFWFRQRNRLIIGLLARLFPQARDYLEIGCGNGAVLSAISRARPWRRLVGSELHSSALRNARKRLPKGAELVQMDARKIPARHAFDFVGAFDVLEHIEEDEAVLGAIAGAVKPGGCVMLAVPQHPSLWSGADDAAYHVRRYRRGELEAKVERAGLEVLHSTSYVALLLPLMMLSRVADRSRRGDASSILRREFEISAAMNAILGLITKAEVTATLQGLRWPAGGSRIVVAKAPA
jgi:SAM-dependent methyltransferase